jgi:DNA polymerase epsilon subunit 2
MFHQRYNIVHQRLMRNESFQAPTVSTARSLLTRTASNIAQSHKITPIVNLLGRSGSQHVILGLLTVSPAGDLTLSDTSGSIVLDLQYTTPVPRGGAYFTPGMVVIVDGTYMEDYGAAAGGTTNALGGTGGIGGTIGGKFIGTAMVHPPTERRAETLGLDNGSGSASGPAFGWTDFLGLGSERAVGTKMRRLQSRMLSAEPDLPTSRTGKIAIAAEVALDSPNTLSALKSMLASYATQPPTSMPLAIVLMGNFAQNPPLAGVQGAGSIEYKECFNALASVLAEFPQVTARTSFVFVPGDKDAWAGAGASGGSTAVPRKPVPEVFTGRIRRAIANASKEEGTGPGSKWKAGEAIWASNPARLTNFGTADELVLFRDDIDGRMRRVGVEFKPEEPEEDPADGLPLGDDQSQPPATNQQPQGDDSDTVAAKRLIRTIVDQGHLSPFPINTRPVQWDYSHALSLYPLPSALVIADTEMAPFAHNYMGCCVMNPGSLVPSGRRGGLEARWVEYSILDSKGLVKTAAF